MEATFQMQAYRRGGVMFLRSRSEPAASPSSAAQTVWLLLDGTLLSFCARAISSEELPGNLERMQFTLIRKSGTNRINKEYIRFFFFLSFFFKAEAFDCTLAFAVFDNAGTYGSISEIVAAMKNSHSCGANTHSAAGITNGMLNNVHGPKRGLANHQRECCQWHVFRCLFGSFTTALVVREGTAAVAYFPSSFFFFFNMQN